MDKAVKGYKEGRKKEKDVVKKVSKTEKKERQEKVGSSTKDKKKKVVKTKREIKVECPTKVCPKGHRVCKCPKKKDTN